MLEDERRQSVVTEGVELEVIATRVDNGQWALTIVNEVGIRYTWMELFASADDTVSTGLKSIAAEGIDVFTDIDEFEYLCDLQSKPLGEVGEETVT